MVAGFQMFFSLGAIALTLALFGGETWTAWTVLAFICVYISAYASHPLREPARRTVIADDTRMCIMCQCFCPRLCMSVMLC